ncbi:endo-1,4-beta-xylanase [Rhodanobacter sp. DHB23]|uniref:endo-1,4-beta-xylanase n=1 Tax=Rhodanobacter sp. DHB23 TaxID=2775923 RepID=UPI00177CB55D|nr:endo-1,4-beta-xylanase [Rhodanobacter sp. DHB23]MBD8871331.1 endo-1,4-beta-xylanase [Rhodanobacter sp. DHB23]
MAMRKIILGLLGLLVLSPAALRAQQAPLAAGQQKFLGSAYSAAQSKDFDRYWNKLTPENAGKWGSVEAVRGQFDWTGLDDAYHFAKAHGMLFHLHVLVWGQQQPEWMRHLPPDQQREEIGKWMDAAAARYPGADFVEVVNEPLHHPPATRHKDGGDYLGALGGKGTTGWDWVIEALRMARARFPHARLLMNDYSIINSAKSTARYRAIVELLQREHLIDGIGLQAHAFVTHGTPASTLRANLDTLAATGLPIYITEMDVDGRDDAVQLREYKRVFPVFWNDPAVKGITLWGFRPGLWRDKQGAYLIRKDGSERPALVWLRDYVRATRAAAQ